MTSSSTSRRACSLPGQLHRLAEQAQAVLRRLGLFVVVHLEGELVYALRPQQRDFGKALHSLPLAAGAALQKLSDDHSAPPARTPEGQAEDRRGLPFSVPIIELDQPLLLCQTDHLAILFGSPGGQAATACLPGQDQYNRLSRLYNRVRPPNFSW